MIAFFKQNLLFTSLMLLPYALLLRCCHLIFPPDTPPSFDGGILYQLIIPFLSHPILQIIISSFLVFIQAWILNQIINRNRLTKSQTNLAGLVYILLMSVCSIFHWLTPIVIANLFVLIGIKEFYKIYKKPKSALFIFNTGLLFGLASMFFQPYLLLIPIGILGILILNSIDLKRLLQFLFGFLLCYYLAYVVFLNMDNAELFLNSLKHINFHNPFPLDIEGYIQLGVITFLIALGLLSYNSYMVKKSIQAQQKINLFYWIMLLSLPAGFFLKELSLFYTMILAIPLAVMWHMNILNLKNSFVGEFFHFFILLGVIAYHFSVHLL